MGTDSEVTSKVSVQSDFIELNEITLDLHYGYVRSESHPWCMVPFEIEEPVYEQTAVFPTENR